jgi:DNA-binding GntR family transcriptional regulator
VLYFVKEKGRKSQVAKIKRESIRDQVRERILERILDGAYPPGHRLRETELVQEFGTSQSPVREALRELEGLHYVETAPFRGTRVREVSTEEMSEAYLLRGVFEQTAAELACTGLNNDWSHLRTIAIETVGAADRGDSEAYSARDGEFHRFIVESAGISLMERVWDLLAFATRARLVLRKRKLPLTDLGKQHMAIVAALEAGDGKRAGELLRAHAEGVKKLLTAQGAAQEKTDKKSNEESDAA